ncbi:hypothetical protein [Sinomonas atrocyanea]|uniref:hypothetical protein n=1 Tax=Sinomonas atrocyanea TaxID=37927 RepID=UPI003D9778D8
MKQNLKRVLTILASTLLLFFGFAASAQAATDFTYAPQGAHYANGYSEPVCTLTNLTVSCTSTQIAGVGNTNATVDLSVSRTFTGYCHNPGSKDKIVDPFTRTDTKSTTANLYPSKNGRLVVPVESATAPSTQQFLATFTCPNPNWTPEVTGTSISYVYSLTFAGFDQPAILITGP